MRKRYIAPLLVGIFLAAWGLRAAADYVYPDPVNGNTTVFAFLCAATKICPAQVLIDSTGTEKATSGNPAIVDTGATGNLINAIKAPPGLSTSGGWTPITKTGLTTTVTAIKTSAGQLGFAQCDNNNGAMVYVQIFNLATGSVTLGVTAPTQVLPIPANLSNGFVMNLVGMQYGTAISVAATTTATGSSAPGSTLNCTFGYN